MQAKWQRFGSGDPLLLPPPALLSPARTRCSAVSSDAELTTPRMRISSRRMVYWLGLIAWFILCGGAIYLSERKRNREVEEAVAAQRRKDERFYEAQYERAAAALRSIALGPPSPVQEQALEVLRVNHNARLQREGAEDEVVLRGLEDEFLPELAARDQSGGDSGTTEQAGAAPT